MCFSRESDSESSDSGPVDESVLGCDSVAGDSDWDSDLSDSDPSRCTRVSAAGSRSAGVARLKRLPVEPDWDAYGRPTEPEAMGELFAEQEELDDGNSGKVTTSMAAASDALMETQPATAEAKSAAPEQQSATKKVTWQFKPAQRSVCTGSRKEKEREFSRFTEIGGDMYRPSPSSSSSSSSSPSSSSSG